MSAIVHFKEKSEKNQKRYIPIFHACVAFGIHNFTIFVHRQNRTLVTFLHYFFRFSLSFEMKRSCGVGKRVVFLLVFECKEKNEMKRQRDKKYIYLNHCLAFSLIVFVTIYLLFLFFMKRHVLFCYAMCCVNGII